MVCNHVRHDAGRGDALPRAAFQALSKVVPMRSRARELGRTARGGACSLFGACKSKGFQGPFRALCKCGFRNIGKPTVRFGATIDTRCDIGGWPSGRAFPVGTPVPSGRLEGRASPGRRRRGSVESPAPPVRLPSRRDRSLGEGYRPSAKPHAKLASVLRACDAGTLFVSGEVRCR